MIKVLKRNKSKSERRKKSRYSLQLQYDKVDWTKVDRIFQEDFKPTLHNFEQGSTRVYTRDLLRLLAAGAIIGLSAAIPTTPIILAPLILGREKFKFSKFGQTVDRLNKQKLVEIFYDDNGEPVVRISKEGKIRALRYKLAEIEIKKPKHWDKKWRMVIFDIPEKYKSMRDVFRSHLKMMGFYKLQKSVWVHAYPCFDEIEFLRQVYGVGIDVSYVIAEKIEDDDFLKSKFELE